MTAATALCRLWRRPWLRMAMLCFMAAATGIGLFMGVMMTLLFALHPGDAAEIFRGEPDVVAMFVGFWGVAGAGSCLTYMQARWMLRLQRASRNVAFYEGLSFVLEQDLDKEVSS